LGSLKVRHRVMTGKSDKKKVIRERGSRATGEQTFRKCMEKKLFLGGLRSDLERPLEGMTKVRIGRQWESHQTAVQDQGTKTRNVGKRSGRVKTPTRKRKKKKLEGLGSNDR